MARFRIMREVPTYAGIRRVEIPHPLQPDTDGCVMCGPDAEHALRNVRRFVPNTWELVAISEEN